MQFKDLLIEHRIDPAKTLVLRHRPQEARLRRALPWLSVDQPKLYNAYQQSQLPDAEKMFLRAAYIASFLGIEAGTAKFVGLYSVNKWKTITYKAYWAKPENIALHEAYGMRGMTPDRKVTKWFDLELKPFYSEWSGKLTVRWPGLERSWKRWADRNVFLINSVSERSAFEPEMPSWDELIIPWSELQSLPKKWRAALQQWRGVYYIFDSSDGRGYIGSAYGADNLLGRWMNYAKSGHGGNKLLRGRDPKNFRFSILRLLNHDENKDEVVRIERTWKSRLHSSKEDGGPNDN